MRIGVDLDNTIICYGPLFHAAAVARKLVPPDLAPSKSVIKSWIQDNLGNHAWTALQSDVYGSLLDGATPYPGAFEFFARCRETGIETCIISHKSQFPALGARNDLRVSALQWLDKHGWFGPDIQLAPADVEFHGTREEKIRAIARRNCDVFIDDLPEVFDAHTFPRTTAAILFVPEGAHSDHLGVRQISHWNEIEESIFSGKLQ